MSLGDIKRAIVCRASEKQRCTFFFGFEEIDVKGNEASIRISN